MIRYTVLEGRRKASQRLHRGDDHLGAAENVVYLGLRRRGTLERRDHRKLSLGRQQAKGFQNTERHELVTDLGA